MTLAALRKDRLRHLLLSHTHLHTPAEVVCWLGAMQAQEYAMAKWAIGMRLPSATAASVEKYFNDGEILRTHVLRPTWHFVAPADIRWMLALTAPRVHALNGTYYKKFELTTTLLKKTRSILERRLRDNHYLTRDALKEAFTEKNIRLQGLPLAYVLMHAELEGVICSGPRQGKQFTYALLDERVPSVKPLPREQALAIMLQRYVNSRGPVTLHDFVYWSGLTMADARAALQNMTGHVSRHHWNEKAYLFNASSPIENAVPLSTTFLMPDYDEYGMSYKHREALVDPKSKRAYREGVDYQHMLVLDGVITGTWKPFKKSNKLSVDIRPFRDYGLAERRRVHKAVERYVAFSCG